MVEAVLYLPPRVTPTEQTSPHEPVDTYFVCHTFSLSIETKNGMIHRLLASVSPTEVSATLSDRTEAPRPDATLRTSLTDGPKKKKTA